MTLLSLRWLRLALPCVLVAGFASAEPQTLIFSHVVSENTPKGKMALMFKSMIERRMGDQFQVEIYPNTELMDDDEAVDAIAEGRIHFAAPSLSKFQNYTTQLMVYDLPFLFADMDAVERFQGSTAGQALLTHMSEDGILGLSYLHNGLKQLTASRDFSLPEDLAGLRFRIIASDVLQKQFELLNAEPVPMAFSQVYQALADNDIQGQENTWSNIYSQAFYEHQSFMMQSNHGVLDYMVITNTDFWNSLTADEQQEFRFAMEMSVKYGNAVALAKNQNDRAAIASMSGVTLHEPTMEQLAQWQNAMKPLWQEYEPQIGADVIEAALDANQTP